ncbi:calcium-binding allergen Ole e 8-like [Olea europaea var. sylvestris]|uniref:calcium-binding allergen Ole e 8-like n=1 Tax=Olea europaea var. sylvestris TaxID=158386 RepID=UPI000C1CDD87|nr:calcium-binding allergen Ole e 8-like [Olea europaea var. sylvestris]
MAKDNNKFTKFLSSSAFECDHKSKKVKGSGPNLGVQHNRNLLDFASFKADTDPYPSYDEEKELKEAFELYNQDHNGMISSVEFHKILMSLDEWCTEQDSVGMIKSVDFDRDRYVSFEKFKKMKTNSSGNNNQ